MIRVEKLNELTLKIFCDKDIAMEIYEKFSFQVAGYQYTPKYKKGLWDGQIHLFNLRYRTLPSGLLVYLYKLAKDNEWQITIDKSLKLDSFDQDLEQFVEDVLPDLILEPYDYQMDAFLKSIKLNRSLVLSPTGSGKSFIIYLIIRFILNHVPGKVLISVPSINLVRQMKTDFCSYESNRFICDQCYELLSGVSKQTSRRVMIATWAMLYRQDVSFFTQFDAFICDEAHQADSMALGKIINMMPHVRYRFGFTGTLDGSKTHELQCRAWFGSLIKSSSTKELMDKGLLSTLEIQSLSIEYSEKDREAMKSSDYQDEISFIVSHPQRNEFLVDLALSQPNNTLLLFNLIERHGEVIFKLAEQKAAEKGKKVFFISGDTNVDRREYIRQTMERENDVVLFASFGTLAVGVNIKNLHTIIFAHPYKARIRTLQSIGRSLRKLIGKEKAKLIDICDNLCYHKHTNFALKHATERLKIYESEGFTVKFESIVLT